jgi:cytochrome c-type biogenesis protein CcmH
MLLWICFALLTAVVVAAILRPVLVGGDDAVSPAAADVAVYKDQLAEIDADRERGLIGEAEATAARTEVARRLLAKVGSTPASATDADASKTMLAKGAVLGGALVIPLLSVALYAVYGSPDLPARPHLARSVAPLDQAPITELVARVEARLRESPDDGNGWDVIAPVYLRMERYQDAADAFRKALRLKGESSQRLAGYAEALVLAGGGIVSEEARAAYERLASLEPGKPEPRFWLALAKEQDGKLAEAAHEYRALLDKAPADAPWREAVADRLRGVLARLGTPAEVIGRIAGGTVGDGSRGRSEAPSNDAMAAAGRMSPQERAEFIKQMVDGLSARLKVDGKDLQGWMRLVRAHKVMGNTEDAVGALTSARANFAGDKAALAELDALAKSLGLGS